MKLQIHIKIALMVFCAIFLLSNTGCVDPAPNASLISRGGAVVKMKTVNAGLAGATGVVLRVFPSSEAEGTTALFNIRKRVVESALKEAGYSVVTDYTATHGVFFTATENTKSLSYAPYAITYFTHTMSVSEVKKDANGNYQQVYAGRIGGATSPKTSSEEWFSASMRKLATQLSFASAEIGLDVKSPQELSTRDKSLQVKRSASIDSAKASAGVMQRESETWSALAKAYRAERSPLSAGDKLAIANTHRLASEWNQESAPLVRDVLDPKVSVEQWLQSSESPLKRLRSICDEMESQAKSVEDAGVKGTLKPCVAAHLELLTAYTELHEALKAGDAEKEQAALQKLRSCGERKMAAGKPIFDRLRESLGNEQVDQILAQEFQSLKVAIAPNGEGKPKAESSEQAEFLKCKTMAQSGDDIAQVELGLKYQEGKEVAKNTVEAVYWWRKAAAKENVKAEFYLGAAYQYGEGVRKDEAEAARLYRRAAERGHAGSQIALAYCYLHGRGVIKDPPQAHAWLNVATAGGAEIARAMLEDLEKKMTPDQKAEATTLARELSEKYKKL